MDISRDAKDGMVPITVTGTPDMVKSGDIRCHTRARAFHALPQDCTEVHRCACDPVVSALLSAAATCLTASCCVCAVCLALFMCYAVL